MNKRLILTMASVLGAVAITVAAAQCYRNSQRKSCHNNLRQIHSAIESSALAEKYGWGDTMPISVFSQYLRPGTLNCPSGGKYNIPTVGGHPTCTYHGDLLVESGDMSGPPSPKEMGIPGWPGAAGRTTNGHRDREPHR